MKHDQTKTSIFPATTPKSLQMRSQLQTVYDALKEKGYNPLNQIVGYILTEDPTYVTNHDNARVIISKIDRDELLRELLNNYLQL